MENNIFREKNLKKITSPDQLNDYIKVSNPSVWIFLTALSIILISFFIWALNGNITSKVTTTGVFNGTDKSEINTITCYVSISDSQKLKPTMDARIYNRSTNNYISGKVENISQIPINKETILSEISKDIDENLLKNDYLVAVTIALLQDDSSTDGFKWHNTNIKENDIIKNNESCKIEIITETIRPLDFLLGKGA